MWTVHQVAKITGVSVRALHHYDTVGLLTPASVTDAGYRLYDEKSLERLGQILLLKELDFSLQEIREILNNRDFDREKALDQQIGLLTLKKERIEKMIAFAEQIKKTGVYKMDFDVFDKEKIERYAEEAKEKWGGTDAYREYSAKTAGYSDEKQQILAKGMMRIFAEIGTMRDRAPADPDVQRQVGRLRDYITENYYTCTKPILAGLGQMYASGGEMTERIDAAGGKGTAAFTASAIAFYCK